MSPQSEGPITVVPGSSDAAKILQEAGDQLRDMGVQVDLDSNAAEVPTYRYQNSPERTITKVVKKVYPNDPCPCGSGKKYKKCCGRWPLLSEPYNPRLKAYILGVVDNQINGNDPPATKITFNRLKKAGYTAQQAKEKIGAVLIGHIYYVMKDNIPMDVQKYIRDLEGLK